MISEPAFIFLSEFFSFRQSNNAATQKYRRSGRYDSRCHYADRYGPDHARSCRGCDGTSKYDGSPTVQNCP